MFTVLVGSRVVMTPPPPKSMYECSLKPNLHFCRKFWALILLFFNVLGGVSQSSKLTFEPMVGSIQTNDDIQVLMQFHFGLNNSGAGTYQLWNLKRKSAMPLVFAYYFLCFWWHFSTFQINFRTDGWVHTNQQWYPSANAASFGLNL